MTPSHVVPVQREGTHQEGHHDLSHEGAGQEGDGQQGHLTGPGLLDVAQLHVDSLHDFRDLGQSRGGRWGDSCEQAGGKSGGGALGRREEEGRKQGGVDRMGAPFPAPATPGVVRDRPAMWEAQPSPALPFPGARGKRPTPPP